VVGLEVNIERTKYMVVSRHQNLGQNHNSLISNRCFENGVKFRYLVVIVTSRNCIHEKIKRRFNSGNSC
jgi:hypothetical protein